MTCWMELEPLPNPASDPAHNLTNRQYECNFTSLQAKYKLVCQVDAMFQKHIDGFREQQKHWRLALDTFMLEAEDQCRAPVATTAKAVALEHFTPEAGYNCKAPFATTAKALALDTFVLEDEDKCKAPVTTTDKASALDTCMLEHEDKCKAPVATTAKAMSTIDIDIGIIGIATREGYDTSLAPVSEESADWAGSGGLSDNTIKPPKDVLQKSQESVDCLGSACRGCEHHPEKSNGLEARNPPCITRDSKRGSTLSKASSHHIARKKSAEDLSTLKKRLAKMSDDDDNSWRERLRRVVFSTPFDGCVFSVILINVLFVGIEVDFIATHPGIEVPHLFVMANYCFATVFTLELLLRLAAIGCSFLYISDNKDWAWNWFDVVVVMSSVLEIGAELIKTESSTMDMVHLRVIRVIRVTRLLRTLRMVRVVRFVRALRILLHSIMATLRAAIWSLLLLLIIFYGFGVGLTQAVMDFCDTLPINENNTFTELEVRAANCQDEALIEFWGTLPRSMFTLFKSVAGGISWHMVVQPLSTAGFLWVMFFVAFITFTLLAVLNVVTGLFCQSAIESARQDKDIATMQLMASKTYHKQALEQLFAEMDVDNSGNLTIHEFEQSLENSRIQAFLESLDICCIDAWALFHLLDADDSGEVDKDEFLEGCLILRGNASAVSMAKMAYDNKIVHEMLEEFMEFMEESISSLRHGTPIRQLEAQAAGPWETHSSGSRERQISPKRAFSFSRQLSRQSKNSRERLSHHK